MGTHTCHNGNFLMNNITSATMANLIKVWLNPFSLFNKVIAYVMDKGSNLNTLTSTLTSVITYHFLQLSSQFVGSYFGHVMSKACQYVYNDSKALVDFQKWLWKLLKYHCKRL
jgi:hypothetical protein